MARRNYQAGVIPGAPWLLDLFCCAGGASEGYHLAGFNVIGVDIKPQPHYPFTFVQADALDVLDDLIVRGNFDTLQGGGPIVAVHASPPCQLYSNAQRIRQYQHPDYIGPTRQRLLDLDIPYVIENVVGAQDELRSPFMLCGAMFNDLRVYRHRLFETNFYVLDPVHVPHRHKQTKMGRWPQPNEFMHVVGNFCGVEEARSAMGIDWMVRDELREAIPPAYTKLIGEDLMIHLQTRRTA